MTFAVFTPIYHGPFKEGSRLVQRPEGRVASIVPQYFTIEFLQRRTLTSLTPEDALREAKRLGYIAPVIGPAT